MDQQQAPKSALDWPVEIDRVCDAFELAWKGGLRPRIEEHLESFPEPHRSTLLRELLLIECAYRFGPHDTFPSSEFFTRFPDHTPVVREILMPSAMQETADYQQTPTSRRATKDRLPEMIGKYRIVERLGAGGQAAVFRAIHPQLSGRDVVIKWAHGSLSEIARQRLIEEGRVLAALDDPGLIRIHDVDEHEGRPFVVFEYVAGRTLREEHQHSPLSCRQAAKLVCELAATLERVHRQGVLHRDLKPANVLIDQHRRPRLMDFGLGWSRSKWDDVRSPQDGICGTVAYMAPEQASGDAERIGAWTDVFGLGAILYELLTGQPPYPAAPGKSDLVQLQERARPVKITSPRELNPRVPGGVSRICMQALAADPQVRYRSAAAMERDLRRYLRLPQVLAATAIAAVLLVGLAFGAANYRSDTPPQPGPVVSAQALEGDLFVKIWSEKKRGILVDEPGALPVQNGEQVQLVARTNEPAYLYLVWIDSQGQPTSLYPWNQIERVTVSPESVRELSSPRELDRGWEVTGPAGLETAILLARRTPLPSDVQLNELLGRSSPPPQSSDREVSWLGVNSSGQARIERVLHRGPGPSTPIDDPGLKLLERLRQHFELVRAVRFAHVAK